MRRKVIYTLALALAIQSLAWAQEADSLMKMVLEQNRELKAAREAYRVSLLEAGTGNTPPDPEIEFAYLFGKPGDVGNRIDFGITQQVDFPSSYIHKSKVKNILDSRAELEYVLVRQEVLLRARQFWIEQVHLNQLHSMLSHRFRQAQTIQKHVERQLETGEVGLLALGQSNLMLASLEGELEEVAALKENNQLALAEITGGVPVEIYDTLLPVPVQIHPDSLMEAYRQGPYAQLYYQGLQLKEAQKNLAVSQHLPKLSAGYYSESVLDVAFRGFRLGMSIPLWENNNTVHKAKAEIAFAEAEADRYTYQQELDVRQQLNKLETLRERTEKLEKALRSANSLSLLTLALQSGEISLSEYFYSSDLYFRNQQQLLRYKRDLLVQEAELLKVYL